MQAIDAHYLSTIGELRAGIYIRVVLLYPALVAEAFFIAPEPGGIVVLQREAQRIDMAMATSALWTSAVYLQAPPHRRFFDAGYTRRNLACVCYR